MTKYVILLAFTAMFLLDVSAQKPADQSAPQPNFSGTWDVDKVKNKYPKDRELIITHNGEELTVEDNSVHENKPLKNKYTLFTDNRGEDNLNYAGGAREPLKVRSKTKWNKNKLVRQSRYESQMLMGNESHQVIHSETQSFSLSEDGNELTIETFYRSQSSLSINPTSTGVAKITFKRRA